MDEACSTAGAGRGQGVSVAFIQRSAVAVAAALAVVAVVAAALTASGRPGTVTTGPPPPPPPPGRSVLLTTSKDGASVDASVGQLVVVRLPGKRTMRWSAVRVSQTGAVLVVSSGSLSADGTSTAVYRVAHDGTARLSATGAPICAPDAACPQFIVLWRASVIVDA